MIGTVSYYWNRYQPSEQEVIGLCLFFLGFGFFVMVGGQSIIIWKNRKWAENLQRRILMIEDIQNERNRLQIYF